MMIITSRLIEHKLFGGHNESENIDKKYGENRNLIQRYFLNTEKGILLIFIDTNWEPSLLK